MPNDDGFITPSRRLLKIIYIYIYIYMHAEYKGHTKYGKYEKANAQTLL